MKNSSLKKSDFKMNNVDYACGHLNMRNYRIINLANPRRDHDAATKEYVDEQTKHETKGALIYTL